MKGASGQTVAKRRMLCLRCGRGQVLGEQRFSDDCFRWAESAACLGSWARDLNTWSCERVEVSCERQAEVRDRVEVEVEVEVEAEVVVVQR